MASFFGGSLRMNAYLADEDPEETNVPALKNFVDRNVKARDDHHARVKQRLRSLLEARSGQVSKKPDKLLTDLNLSLACPATEAEVIIPDLDSFGKGTEDIKSPMSVQSQPFSPTTSYPVTVQEDCGGGGVLADQVDVNLFPVCAEPQTGLGLIIDDQTAPVGVVSHLQDGSTDPLMYSQQRAAGLDLDMDFAVGEVLAIENIKDDLKNNRYEVQSTGADMEVGLEEELDMLNEWSDRGFLDELMNEAPVQQGQNFLPWNDDQKFTPQEPLLFNEQGDFMPNALPPFQTICKQARPLIVTPAPPPITVEIPHEGRRYKIPVDKGASVGVVMEEFKKQSRLTEDFFLVDVNFKAVDRTMVLDQPRNYTFTVTVLPKPVKPPRRRPLR